MYRVEISMRIFVVFLCLTLCIRCISLKELEEIGKRISKHIELISFLHGEELSIKPLIFGNSIVFYRNGEINIVDKTSKSLICKVDLDIENLNTEREFDFITGKVIENILYIVDSRGILYITTEICFPIFKYKVSDFTSSNIFFFIHKIKDKVYIGNLDTETIKMKEIIAINLGSGKVTEKFTGDFYQFLVWGDKIILLEQVKDKMELITINSESGMKENVLTFWENEKKNRFDLGLSEDRSILYISLNDKLLLLNSKFSMIREIILEKFVTDIILLDDRIIYVREWEDIISSNIATGKELFHIKNSNTTTLIGVKQNILLFAQLVPFIKGENLMLFKVTALALENGHILWDSDEWNLGVNFPYGEFDDNEVYFVASPTEVISVDIRNGKILSKF